MSLNNRLPTLLLYTFGFGFQITAILTFDTTGFECKLCKQDKENLGMQLLYLQQYKFDTRSSHFLLIKERISFVVHQS